MFQRKMPSNWKWQYATSEANLFQDHTLKARVEILLILAHNCDIRHFLFYYQIQNFP